MSSRVRSVGSLAVGENVSKKSRPFFCVKPFAQEVKRATLVKGDIAATNELIGGEIEEKVIGRVQVVAEVDTGLSFGCKFAAVGATFLRVEEDISCTPPYAERTCTGLGAGPQFSGSDGRPKRVRVKVVQQRGMKEGVTPKGRWCTSVSEKTASDLHESAIATFGNAILLRTVGKGEGLANALGGTERLKGMVSKFATAIGMEALD
ncbi:hypothetical protein CLOP_g2261 [Closterium sp. NIES-67]|nr:hypothetical protein CLOP_g2261 [Closterium sp. NIES-67]